LPANRILNYCTFNKFICCTSTLNHQEAIDNLHRHLAYLSNFLRGYFSERCSIQSHASIFLALQTTITILVQTGIDWYLW